MDWRKYEHMEKKEENGQGGTPHIQKNETQVTLGKQSSTETQTKSETALQVPEPKEVEPT